MRNVTLFLTLAAGFLVVTGCCKKHRDVVYYLEEEDKALMPYRAGDTIKLQDSATAEVFTFVVEKVSFEVKEEADGFPIGCVNCPPSCERNISQEAEVGEVKFKDGENKFVIYREGTGSLEIHFRMAFENESLEFIADFGDNDISYYSSFESFNTVYSDVSQLGIITSTLSFQIFTSKKEGIILIRNLTTNKTYLRKES